MHGNSTEPGSPPGSDTRTDRVVRLSVNLNTEAADILKEYAGRKGISITEAIRRAIGVLHFVDENQGENSIALLNRDGKIREIVLPI